MKHKLSTNLLLIEQWLNENKSELKNAEFEFMYSRSPDPEHAHRLYVGYIPFNEALPQCVATVWEIDDGFITLEVHYGEFYAESEDKNIADPSFFSWLNDRLNDLSRVVENIHNCGAWVHNPMSHHDPVSHP